MPSEPERTHHRLFHAPPPWPDRGGELVLPASESRHALRVLRLQVGDSLRLVDGQGRAADAIALGVRRGVLRVRIVGGELVDEPGPQIELGLPYIRCASRLDWAFEKGTELGVRRFHLFRAERSLKGIAAQPESRVRRWRELTRAAMKQAGRAWWPGVVVHPSLQALVAGAESGARVIVADAHGANCREGCHDLRELARLLLLVGPEGGFGPQEMEVLAGCGALRIALGPHRLRTETAAVALCAWAAVPATGVG